MARKSVHGQWSSRLAFILAATGSAVGLGNIWKFPYVTGENGGGAFVLVYILCVACVGLPIMVAEILIGRRGRQNPMDSMGSLARDDGCSPHWQWVGLMGVFAGFLILSFYSVIAGWAVAYFFRAATGLFRGVTATSSKQIFQRMIADPERLIAWHTAFLAMTMFITARGVASGLERASKIMMPALFVILLIMVGYGLHAGDAQRAIDFLFRADFHRLSAAGVLEAMGQAFFSLSLGMGAIMIYGSYLPAGISITRSALVVAVSDTVVALLAGLAIFPVVFSQHLHVGSGPGLIFVTLPIAFGHMPYGALFGALFFLLLVFAAWTSAISLMEPPVTWLVERHRMSRFGATLFTGGVVWVLGLGTVFSFNLWSGVTLWHMTFFDAVDNLTSNIMLPLGGFAISVFAAGVMARESSAQELQAAPTVYRVWRFLARFVAPAAVALVFLNAIGVLRFR